MAIPNMTSEVRVSACVGVAPQIACDVFYIYAVSTISGTRLIKSGGDEQYVTPGATFLPVTVRMSDLSDPPNVVAGVPLNFHMVAYRAAQCSRKVVGEVVSSRCPAAVAIASEDVTAYTNGWGLASYVPKVSGSGLIVQITASSGNASIEFALHTWPSDSPATRRNTVRTKATTPAQQQPEFWN
jgi:hypothetical protein